MRGQLELLSYTLQSDDKKTLQQGEAGLDLSASFSSTLPLPSQLCPIADCHLSAPISLSSQSSGILVTGP